MANPASSPRCIANPKPEGCLGTPVKGSQFCAYCYELAYGEPPTDFPATSSEGACRPSESSAGLVASAPSEEQSPASRPSRTRPSSQPVKPVPTARPMSDAVWRLRMSANLRDLAAEVKALTEVVLAMNEKLAASEAQSQDTSPK